MASTMLKVLGVIVIVVRCKPTCPKSALNSCSVRSRPSARTIMSISITLPGCGALPVGMTASHPVLAVVKIFACDRSITLLASYSLVASAARDIIAQVTMLAPMV